ncbi:hypothetical protein CONLIGDRAFT_684672 [Coniochaeta ligniaria NRRL 30616]|uniref:Uncharacterized protein n=1 Tax=Coniochaeta ligniaria NRRL 30616 TaxID=1408157 RepID=A0A1J7IEL0_9PEZI|nr:hypothetical protein CONLIGDRAFT_684672 [Coniochaeta ligniaria NRRL 30616]
MDSPWATAPGFGTNTLIVDTIIFRHPSCPLNLNIILDLPRVDNVPGRTIRGVHYRTALTACEIIAHNAFGKGYFTLDPEGFQRVYATEETVLHEAEYYFRITGGDRYTLTRTFRD